MAKLSIDSKDLHFYRSLLLLGGLCYFFWYFAVDFLLPSAFNPLISRLIVCGFCFLFFFLSFKSEYLKKYISAALTFCIFLVTLHYFYLFWGNKFSTDWIVGSFITVIASIMCLYASRSLLWYAVSTSICAFLICVINPELWQGLFFPGLVTILLLGTLGSRSRIKLVDSLKDSFSRFYILFNSTFEGIVVHEEGTIVELNKPFSKMFGYEEDELIGRDIKCLVIPEDMNMVSQKINSESEQSFEAVGERRDKSRFAIEICSRTYIGNGRPLKLAAIRNITERKQVELERIRLAAAEEAIRNRDEFMSIASHELKTPLTTIQLQTQIYLRDRERGFIDSNESRTSRFVELISHQSGRLIRLVEDMLDVSRISEGRLTLNLEVCDLSILSSEILKIERESTDADQTIVLKADKPVLVYIDKNRMEQALTNLISNAFKYGQNNPITFSVESFEGKAILTIEDKGMGIAPENLERIFQRFERAVPSKNISGLGLGLYISKQIIDAHHGRIFVESVLGIGSKFIVELDLYASQPKK